MRQVSNNELLNTAESFAADGDPGLYAVAKTLMDVLQKRVLGAVEEGRVVYCNALGRNVNLSRFPKNYNIIPAIKAIRTIFGLGLKEAKDFVEQNRLFVSAGGVCTDMSPAEILRVRQDNEAF